MAERKEGARGALPQPRSRGLPTRLFPPGTRRRLLAGLVFKAAAHPVSFLRNLEVRNIRHFFYLLRKTDAAALEQMVDSRLQASDRRPGGPGGVTSVKEIEKLVFTPSSAPLVSIIIPVYNHWQYTHGCLKSILKNTVFRNFEIIIADDCSNDETGEMLKKVAGVRVVRNERNLGFVLNCNMASRLARGKYLLFLNNDIFVSKDWLEPLVSLAESDEKIGIAGSKVVDKDGRLQECGWIMQSDGWGFPVGRGDDPSQSKYCRAGEVDCISGCCFLVRRTVFEGVGRFDERFAPAYYEEFDLCFAVKDRGYKVMLEPASVVTHYDAASYGYSQRNPLNEAHGRIFLEKWRQVLNK